MRFSLNKLKGGGSLPAAPVTRDVLFAWFGGFLAIMTLSALTQYISTPLLLGSFGASCVLVFGYPDAPFSQPRNIVFGHLMSSLIGLICIHLLGVHWWSVAIAVATSISMMMLTKTVHPPAGSNPVIIFLTQPAWSFLIFPTLVGALIIVSIALVFNNLNREKNYPKYW